MTVSRSLAPMVCVIALLGCDANPATQKDTPPPPRPVLSMVVTRQAVAGEAFTGTIQPRISSSMGFLVPGRVMARDVNVGDRVTRGQRLAAIDPLALNLSVTSAQAGLASASAQNVATLASEGRLAELFQRKVISPAQFESVQQGREATAAAVTRAEALLDMAADQLSHADLRAEFDGVVTSVTIEPGQTVAAGQPVIVVASPDVLEAVIDVPDRLAATLAPGAAFRVSTQTEPDRIVVGTVREIAPRVDTLTMSRRVKISLADPPSTMRLGTTIVARLDEVSGGSVEVPETALLDIDGKPGVWVVDPKALTVSLRIVEIGKRENGSVSVSKGLEEGSRVVTAGVHSLVEGQAIRMDSEAR